MILSNLKWFLVYEKSIKYFFMYKNVNKILPEKTKKDFEKRLAKGIKIFLKKKKKKSFSVVLNNKKNLSEDEKQRIAERRRNYYITYKK